MAARWLDSMIIKEERRAVVVHGVVCAPVQCDGVTLLCDAVHAVAVPREFGVFVPAERPTNVRDHCYLCKIHAVAVPHEFGVVLLGERQTGAQDDWYSCEIQVRARRLEMEKE